jgi:serine/threonine protein kinase
MQHPCNTRNRIADFGLARMMGNTRNTHATPMQNPQHPQHPCNTHATPMQHPCNRIADFGLARMMGNNANGLIMLSKTTNPRWTAPEVIRESAIGTAGDVYSFAIIMWEFLTFQQPYEEMMSVQVGGCCWWLLGGCGKC